MVSVFFTYTTLYRSSNYDVDAIFANRWEGNREVSCAPQTAQMFRDDTGYDLPHLARTDDPAWPVYQAWRSAREVRQRSEEHTSELQSRGHLVCRLLLEKKKKNHACKKLNFAFMI